MDYQEQEEHRHNPESKPSSSFSSQSMGREEREREKEEEEGEEEILKTEKARKETVPKSKPIFLGRHRISAAISQLNSQITVIQEELNELETVGQSSIVCKELISSLDTIPDPLLPTINGPSDVNWDRWFRGAHDDSKSHKRWI